MCAISRTKLRNTIYKETQKLTSHLYHDDYWYGVTLVKNKIQEIIDDNGSDYELCISVPNGGYHTSSDGMSQWKSYIIKISYDNNVVLAGTLNCHAAGTINDPFKSYDMSLVISFVTL